MRSTLQAIWLLVPDPFSLPSGDGLIERGTDVGAGPVELMNIFHNEQQFRVIHQLRVELYRRFSVPASRLVGIHPA